VASLPIEARADSGVRSLVTPEGVDLRVRLATVVERAVALVIDLTIMVGSLLVLTIAVGSALVSSPLGASSNLVAMIWLLGFFVLRNFYFTLFEGGRRAATPGKRLMGLRVVARDGAALSTDAVVARNAMRELELFLPLVFLFSRGNAVENWTILAGIVWCFVFVLFPLFNRDRLRAGDLHPRPARRLRREGAAGSRIGAALESTAGDRSCRRPHPQEDRLDQARRRSRPRIPIALLRGPPPPPRTTTALRRTQARQTR